MLVNIISLYNALAMGRKELGSNHILLDRNFTQLCTAYFVANFNFTTKQLGAQEPLGFYDPLGLLNDADEARFQRLRYVELKHGRIAQLAFLGQIVTRAGIHLPGNIDLAGNSFDSFPDGLAAISGPDAIPQAGLGQIVLFVGLLELFVMKDGESF